MKMSAECRALVGDMRTFLACIPEFALYSYILGSCPIEESKEVQSAGTDGSTIFLNYDWLKQFTSPRPPNRRTPDVTGQYSKNAKGESASFVLLHEAEHVAGMDVFRGKRHAPTDPRGFNIACDAIVNMRVTNSAVSAYGHKMPENGVAPAMGDDAKLSKEQLYDKMKNGMKNGNPGNPGNPGDPGDPGEPDNSGFGQDLLSKTPSDASKEGKELGRNKVEAEKIAKERIGEAIQYAKMRGISPAGAEREFDAGEARSDWRAILRDFVVNYVSDFRGWDRRFIANGTYIDDMQGDMLPIDICVDTSGSIHGKLLNTMLSEVGGILAAFDRVEARLWWADADVYGPYEVTTVADIPKAQGGGGTSFVPFFEKVKDSIGCKIYMTDGYGYFPEEEVANTLWVALPGTTPATGFPWGTVVVLHE